MNQLQHSLYSETIYVNFFLDYKYEDIKVQLEQFPKGEILMGFLTGLHLCSGNDNLYFEFKMSSIGE